MMDKRPGKELIDGIRDSLRNFEETYERREWEHFQWHRKNKRRRPVSLFLKLSGIAASLFLMVYAAVIILPFFEGTNDNDARKSIPKAAPLPAQEKEQERLDTLAMDSITHAVDPTHSFPLADSTSRQKPGINKIVASLAVTPLDVIPVKKVSSMADSMSVGQPLRAIPYQTTPLIGKFYGKTQSSLADGVDLGEIIVGFSITPAFTNKGFSLGGGVSAQIPLSDRLSAEAGVSYMNLKVGTDWEIDKTDTGSRQVAGIRHSVGMIALPVSFNYAVSGDFAVSLGLVPFRVVRDRQTDIFQSYKWIIGDVTSGDTTARLVGERTLSKRADSLYKSNNYLGFIQVSGRYRPPFLKKRNMVISPFIAIPVGKLSDDKHRWLHGGVSIRVDLR